jgi:DNA-binding NarL/FixJ family response regulator
VNDFVKETPLRIVIAEDSGLLRAGIARLLIDSGHQVVAEAQDGPSFLLAIEEHHPDVVVVDVRMPPGFKDEGLKAALEARSRDPHLAVLVLSQYVEERYGRELLESGAEGTGYLLKDRVADVGEFVSALEEVGSGGTVLDPEVVGQLLARGAMTISLRSPLAKGRSSPSSPRVAPTTRSPVRSSSPKGQWRST